MGVEQHPMALQGVGAQQESPAMQQLDMRHPQLHALATQNRKVLAPVELEGIAGIKIQRHESPARRRLLVALPIRPPPSGKGGNPI